MSQIKDLISKLAETGNEIYSLPCEVVSVNTTKRTCTVKPSNGSPLIYKVRLQALEGGAVGVFAKPKAGSSVLVSFLSKNFAFVALTSEIDELLIDTPKTVFNGGQNGGLIKVSDMVATFNSIINDIASLRLYLASHTHGGSTPNPPPPSNLSPVNAAQFSNDKVKH
jgi:hypothetical protein